MNVVTSSYMIYLVVSIGLTMWVARTLFRSGRPFLVEAFGGNADLADSVNHLLVVGFYLINIGYVTLALKYGDKPVTTTEAFEFLSTKVGLVLLILGAMHFFNILSFAKLRRRAKTQAHGAHLVATPFVVGQPVGAPIGGDAT